MFLPEMMIESKPANHVRLELPAELRPYQRKGVAFLVERRSALLADQMGLGKTVQAAVALQVLNLQQGWFRSLVICPASLRLNWERELERWAPRLVVRRVEGDSKERGMLYRLPIQVLIASYDQIRVDVGNLHPKVDFDLILLESRFPHWNALLSGCGIGQKPRLARLFQAKYPSA